MNITIDQGIEAFSCATMPEGFFELLPREAVRFSKFPVTTRHNAIWDFGFGHGGTMYAALCGELGRLFFKPAKGPVFSSTQPVGVAVSPDAKRVAVSVADALGCIYVYHRIAST